MLIIYKYYLFELIGIYIVMLLMLRFERLFLIFNLSVIDWKKWYLLWFNYM